MAKLLADQTLPFASTTTLIEEFRALPEGDKFSGPNTTLGENWQAIACIVTTMSTSAAPSAAR